MERLLFYPASGFRGSDSGAFASISVLGVLWSSASSDAMGYYLRFTNAEVQAVRINAVRANGYVVRCVQYLLLLNVYDMS